LKFVLTLKGGDRLEANIEGDCLARGKTNPASEAEAPQMGFVGLSESEVRRRLSERDAG